MGTKFYFCIFDIFSKYSISIFSLSTTAFIGKLLLGIIYPSSSNSFLILFFTIRALFFPHLQIFIKFHSFVFPHALMANSPGFLRQIPSGMP